MGPDKAAATSLRSIFDEPYDPPGWGMGKLYGKRSEEPPNKSAIENIMHDYSKRFAPLISARSKT